MAEEPRRRLLLTLYERDRRAEVQIPGDIIQRDQKPDRLRVELEHIHLPLLEEMGFIRYDRESSEVTIGPRFGRISPLLELLNEHPDDVPDSYIQ